MPSAGLGLDSLSWVLGGLEFRLCLLWDLTLHVSDLDMSLGYGAM